MPTPEEQARQRIDQLLEETGWQVQDRNPRGPFLYRSTELAGQTCSARARLGQ
jgi:type I site-specific restriction endonuclease